MTHLKTQALALTSLLVSGCYDRHTQLVDAWYPGGPDAAVVDARALPPDAFTRPDAFVPRDAFVRPDATFDADLHPARDAILDGCASSPNMYAVESPDLEVVANTLWRPSFPSATLFYALNAMSELVHIEAGSSLTLGTFPLVAAAAPPPGTIGLDWRAGTAGCRTRGGEMTIDALTIEYGATARITRLRATFTQECRDAVVRGCISYTAR